jgi:hypothetical protein
MLNMTFQDTFSKSDLDFVGMFFKLFLFIRSMDIFLRIVGF